MKLKIKKGDTVEVIAGSQKGTKGAVMSVNPEKMRVKVQGVRIQTNFDKKEGIFTAEGYIDYSNVKLVESAAKATKKAAKKAATKSKT